MPRHRVISLRSATVNRLSACTVVCSRWRFNLLCCSLLKVVHATKVKHERRATGAVADDPAPLA